MTMKNTLHSLLAAACAVAFLAGCGDSGSNAGESKKSSGKKSSANAALEVVKLTGNAVADQKAVLEKVIEIAPRIQKAAEAKSASLSGVSDGMTWAKLIIQLQEVWKKATPAEREELQKHADALLEKYEDNDTRNALLGVLVGAKMAAESE